MRNKRVRNAHFNKNRILPLKKARASMIALLAEQISL